MTLAPIALFAYNRPAHLRRCVESLLRNEQAKDSPLFIISDGARHAADQPQVDEVRQYIRSLTGFGRIHIIERAGNLGLAGNIIDAVTQIVSSHGSIIVVEDDLVVAPHFLRFMNDALRVYRDEDRVAHIQACDFTKDPALPETFLIQWTGSWGWATWDRAWRLFNPDGAYLLQELTRRGLTRRFDFNGTYGFTRMLRRQVEGRNNSWAIRWNASLFLQDRLSLNVGRSLVQNEGFDGSGTNCGGGRLYASDLYPFPIPVAKIEPVEENGEAREAFARYYARTNSFVAKAVRRIKRTLKGDFRA